MRGSWDKRKIGLTAAAVILAGGVSIQGAMAYFTTYASAEGSQTLELGATTEIEEDFKDWTKEIKIQNTGDVDCYVRVKVFAGSQFTIDYSGYEDAWSKGEDDYWYYNDVVPVGGSTSALLATINLPSDFEEDFNVAVVQECTPVQYNEDGTPYADWSLKVAKDSGEEAGA